MPFVDAILKYKSVSIVGLEKNTGKTECLNYVLRRLHEHAQGNYHGKRECRIAITSIGIDGESVDQIRQNPKPEITVFRGMTFVTSEKHFREKRLTAAVLDVLNEQTSLGRLVVGRAVESGKVLLSGPAQTRALRRVIDAMDRFGIDTTLVDGALSRLSLASPAVTDAMILATGAALSANIPQLVAQTKYTCDLIELEEVDKSLRGLLEPQETGIWAVDKNGKLHDLEIESAFLLEQHQDRLFSRGNTLYVTGAVSDKLLTFLRMQREIREIRLVVRDFTKLFATQREFNAYLKAGGQISVLQRPKLLAVTVNPVSPDGYRLDSATLCRKLSEVLSVPVYDLRCLSENPA